MSDIKPIKKVFSPHTVIVSRVQRFYDYPSKIFPVSCTRVEVQDSYFNDDLDDTGNPIHNFYETIAGSRYYVSKVLKGNAGVVVDLSKIRPKGTMGANGMISAGVGNFMQAYSVINQEIRRGSAFRNGAVVLQLDSGHPDLEDFLNISDLIIPWCKRGVNLEKDWMSKPYYPLLKDAIAKGKVFAYKQQYDQRGRALGINVCLTGDVYISTIEGVKTVSSLVGKQFSVVRDGEVHHSTPTPIYLDGELVGHKPPGFFSTGINPVYKLKTKEGHSITATANHQFLLATGQLTALHHLNPGDEIKFESVNGSPDHVTVDLITYIGEWETYNCTIDHDDHLYIANGFVSKNCQGIQFISRSTCTLAHLNLGLVEKIADIPNMLLSSAKDLNTIWEDFAQAQKSRSGQHFIDPAEDKQVGLGVLGLSNLLARFKISYYDFAKALDFVTKAEESGESYFGYIGDEGLKLKWSAYLLAYSLQEAYILAGRYFHGKGYLRSLTIEPTATCAYKQKDLQGYTTSPEISPPIAHPQTKISRRRNDDEYVDHQHHPDCEVAGHDVDWETYDLLCISWQRMMENTGQAHALSYNWWMSKPVDDKTLASWDESPLKTIYYRWQEAGDAADKSSIGIVVDEEGEAFWTMDEEEEGSDPAVICQLDGGGCTSCGE